MPDITQKVKGTVHMKSSIYNNNYTNVDVVGKDCIGQVEDEVARKLCVCRGVQVQDLTATAAQLEAGTQLVAHVLGDKPCSLTQGGCPYYRHRYTTSMNVSRVGMAGTPALSSNLYSMSK